MADRARYAANSDGRTERRRERRRERRAAESSEQRGKASCGGLLNALSRGRRDEQGVVWRIELGLLPLVASE